MRPPISLTDLTPIVSLPSLYNPRDLALIRRTVASDTTDDEFALFIHWARSLRLDPLRRQVHAFVFHKQDQKKRRLSLVTSIEGFRAIAARTGNYRPDENEPAFIIDDALKTDTNPAGLVSCSVRVWQYAHGQWFPIMGVARWDEFAPIKTVWVDNQPTDRKALDKSGRWADIRRFLLHVLPRGFHRIRHYGLLASSTRKASIDRARELLAAPPPLEPSDPEEPSDSRPPCPCCGGRMIIIETLGRWMQPRAPPQKTASTGNTPP